MTKVKVSFINIQIRHAVAEKNRRGSGFKDEVVVRGCEGKGRFSAWRTEWMTASGVQISVTEIYLGLFSHPI